MQKRRGSPKLICMVKAMGMQNGNNNKNLKCLVKMKQNTRAEQAYASIHRSDACDLSVVLWRLFLTFLLLWLRLPYACGVQNICHPQQTMPASTPMACGRNKLSAVSNTIMSLTSKSDVNPLWDSLGTPELAVIPRKWHHTLADGCPIMSSSEDMPLSCSASPHCEFCPNRSRS